MRTAELKPEQIITLNDYPLYSNSVLSGYLERCRAGEGLPFVPVIRKSVVRPHLGTVLSKLFLEFERQHPEAGYFMLDGSHRTTALTLVGRDIAVVLYETDGDIIAAREHVATGEILLNGTLDYTLEENCGILKRHFQERPTFMTVLEKTEKLRREGLLPH